MFALREGKEYFFGCVSELTDVGNDKETITLLENYQDEYGNLYISVVEEEELYEQYTEAIEFIKREL